GLLADFSASSLVQKCIKKRIKKRCGCSANVWLRMATVRSLFGHDPSGLQDRIRYQPDDRRDGDEKRIVHLPTKQDRTRNSTDKDCQPISYCNTAKQKTSAQNGADGGCVGAANETLDVRIRAVTREQGRHDKDENE